MIKNLLLTICFLLFSSLVYADNQNGEIDYSNNLTGDWQGKRLSLYNHGIDIQAAYIIDNLYNVTGGIKKGNDVLSNIDLEISIDGEKLYNLSGSKAFIYVSSNHSQKPNAKRVGSVLQVDNIELIKPTTTLCEAWLSQDFLDNKFSILAGLYDLGSEFYVTESAGLFLQPTYGVGAEFATTGLNGPSLSPATSLATRIKIKPYELFYAQFAVLDGVGGNPDKPKGTHIHLKKKDGALLISEIGINSEFGNYGFGLWQYSKKFDSYNNQDVNGNISQYYNYGGYVMAEKILYTQSEQEKITSFLRFGKANEKVSQIRFSWSAGLVYNGIVHNRDDSQLGIAVARAYLSKQYCQSQNDSGFKARKQETALEITYSDKLTPWLQIQPDFQYIFNPATSVDITNNNLKNAFIIGIRFSIAI